jgi:hypothetical protein
METTEILNSKSVKGFVKSLLLVVSFFIVFSCGFASLVLYFGQGNSQVLPEVPCLIWFLAGLPLIVFLVFLIVFACVVKQINKT